MNGVKNGLGIPIGNADTDTSGPITIELDIDSPVIHVTRGNKTEDITLDVAPWCPRDTTLIPVRGVFEALGAEVSWIPSYKKVSVLKGDTMIELVQGSATAMVYTETKTASYTLREPVQVRNNRTMIPLRFISEALGYGVQWNPSRPTHIVITSK